MGKREAQDYLKHTLLFVIVVVPDLLSRDSHWALRPNPYAMNSYPFSATTVVCPGIRLKTSFCFILFFRLELLCMCVAKEFLPVLSILLLTALQITAFNSSL